MSCFQSFNINAYWNRKFFDPVSLEMIDSFKRGMGLPLFKINEKQRNSDAKIEIYKNTFFVKESFASFSSRLPKVPPVQREFTSERVNEFYTNITAHYQKYVNSSKESQAQPVPYLGQLIIGVLKNGYTILDGQHRYRALLRFANQTLEDFDITYILRNFDSMDDMDQFFYQINDRFELYDSLKSETFTDTRKGIVKYLKEKYTSHISPSLHPRYPNINIDVFIDKFCYERLPKGSLADMINLIEEENNRVGQYLKYNKPELYQSAYKKQQFYLSYVLQKSEIKRKPTPASIRKSLWQRDSTCFCNG